MLDYHGPEVSALVDGIIGKLQRFLDTDRDVLLLSATGTGGLEAVVQNTLSPGERVVGVDAGVFGKRFAAVAQAFGASVRAIDVEWGRALDPDTLRAVLRQEARCRAVLLTHNETSTGVRHPIEELVAVVKSESDALVCVDAVSSLGAMPLAMDELGIDVIVTGSQKAWGVPPGMAIVCLSAKAWQACERATMPRFYFDLRRYREAHRRSSFPFTPALPIVYGLDVALELMLRETAGEVFARHARIAAHARARVEAMGYELFAEREHPSPTVTAIRVPESVDEPALVELLRVKHDTVVARGQQRLRGRIVRLGHLGWVHQAEIDAALDALGLSLAELQSAE
jgi:aspartate aminotransferase-like enzyme